MVGGAFQARIPVIATAAAIQGRDLMTCLKREGDGRREPAGVSRRPGGGPILVRRKTATSSASSLVTLRSFQPRFRMSARQVMSFSQSFRARPEDPDVRYPVPRLRIWSVSILHRAGLCRHAVLRAEDAPKAMSPLEIAGGAKKADGRRGVVSPRSPVYPGRPVSRVLFPGAEAPGDGHLSGTVVANRLEQPTRG